MKVLQRTQLYFYNVCKYFLKNINIACNFLYRIFLKLQTLPIRNMRSKIVYFYNYIQYNMTEIIQYNLIRIFKIRIHIYILYVYYKFTNCALYNGFK